MTENKIKCKICGNIVTKRSYHKHITRNRCSAYKDSKVRSGRI